jgi:hypothetical protein
MPLLALTQRDLNMKRAKMNVIAIPTQVTSLKIYENSKEKANSSKSFE